LVVDGLAAFEEENWKTISIDRFIFKVVLFIHHFYSRMSNYFVCFFFQKCYLVLNHDAPSILEHGTLLSLPNDLY